MYGLRASFGSSLFEYGLLVKITYDLQSLQYFLSGPIEKKFTNPNLVLSFENIINKI